MSASYKDLGLELSSDDSPPPSPDSIPAPKPPIARPIPPKLGKKIPMQQNSPIIPQTKKAVPQTENIEQLLSRITNLKVTHQIEMREKITEIHFLKCLLNSDQLKRFDLLMNNKLPENWISCKNLEKITKMSSTQVEQDIVVRGYQHKLRYDPDNSSKISQFSHGSRLSLRKLILGKS